MDNFFIAILDTKEILISKYMSEIISSIFEIKKTT